MGDSLTPGPSCFSKLCFIIEFLLSYIKWDSCESESHSHVWLFATPWTIQSMEFSRPEYWSVYLFPSPGDFPNPGIKPRSSTLQSDSLPAEPPGKPKSTGVDSLVGCHALLLGIFRSRNRIRVSCIKGGFFTSWATREALYIKFKYLDISLYYLNFIFKYMMVIFLIKMNINLTAQSVSTISHKL